MKKRLIVLAVLVSGTGCLVSDDSPLLLGNFRPFDSGTCKVTSDENLVRSSGTLDVAGTTLYMQNVDVISQTAGVSQPSGEPGSDVNQSSPNEIIIDTIELDYESSEPLNPELTPMTASKYFVVQPGSRENHIVIDFFPGEAQGLLMANVFGDISAGTTIKVGVRAIGRTRSGTAVSSNRAVYPIYVYRSAFAGCAAGEVPAATGPCGMPGGQDGSLVGCCPSADPSCLST